MKAQAKNTRTQKSKKANTVKRPSKDRNFDWLARAVFSTDYATVIRS